MMGVVNGYELITLSLCNGKRTIRITFLVDGKPYAINELLEDYIDHNKKVEAWSESIPWTTIMYELQRIIYQ